MTRIAALLAVAAVSGLAGYSIAERDPREPAPMFDAVLAPDPGSMSTRTEGGAAGPSLSQSVGTRCSTSRGECRVSSAPINSYCTCNGSPGRIVR